MSSSPDVEKRSHDLGCQIAKVIQHHPSDVIMNALLSGVVTVIRRCYPEEDQANAAAQFGSAIMAYVCEPTDERGTIQ